MISIKGYKDFGSGLCVILSDELSLNGHKFHLNKENLELRIKNLKDQDLDANVEDSALIEMNKLLNLQKEQIK